MEIKGIAKYITMYIIVDDLASPLISFSSSPLLTLHPLLPATLSTLVSETLPGPA